ncbi:MAG TPA: sugar ABC transporter ATP-binding protein [Roseiarcus sp.]|nr:sugar ABC transporter ATP-binding protein [Roseiarcus sp.]
MPEAPLLVVRGIAKRFPGTLALDDFDIDVRVGEVHALLGENGAGKSTFIKVLAGVYPPDSGEIRLADAPLRQGASAAAGIAFVHQDLALVDSMSVMENIGHVSGFPRHAGLISWRDLRRQAAATLATLEVDIDPAALVSRLSQAQKSVVAIARAFATPNVRLLVLDEPTASLPEKDVARVFRTLERLKQQQVGMIFVTHRLDEVFRIADRVTVMRDGRRVLTTATQDASRDELVEAIVGRAPDEVFVRDAARPTGPSIVEFDSVVAGATGPCSFSVGAGEIVALVGLEGAGQSDMSRLIVGDIPLAGGAVRFCGTTYERPSARRSVNLGIGFVSAKRSAESVAADRTIRENLFVNPSIPNRLAGRWISPAAERRDALALMRRFGVRARSPETPVAALSGGNQQKVVLARWLGADRRLLVLEEPTAGVDVGAKAEIYRLLLSSLQQGCAVLLVSSDFEEVCGIAGRALVFYGGRIVGELAGPELSMARLVRAATGDAIRTSAHYG